MSQATTTGAMSAVKDGVAQSLARAAGAIADAASRKPDLAFTSWQQAHGVLRMVGHAGVVRFSDELGNLLAAMKEAPAAEAAAAQEQANTFKRASDALVDYMGVLATGGKGSPMRLYADYSELLKARGVEQAAESDLYFPDLTLGPPDRQQPQALSDDELRALRRTFERGLLPWLRSADASSSLDDIASVLDAIEASRASGKERALWWVALAVVEALTHKGLSADFFIKRLISQLNLQIGRLIQGDTETPDTLLRAALYQVAKSAPVTEHVRTVQETYALKGTLEADTLNLTAELVVVSQRLRDSLAELQAAWQKFAQAEVHVDVFCTQAADFAKSCKFPGAELAALLNQLVETGAVLKANPAKMNDRVAIEVACALLLVDSGCAVRFGGSFGRRAQNVSERISASLENPGLLATLPPPELLDEEAKRAEDTLVRSHVFDTIENGLRKAEEQLDAFFRKNAKPDDLKPLDKSLRQYRGVLTLLREDAAAELLDKVTAGITRSASNDGGAANDNEKLAKQLTALVTYIAALRQGPSDLMAIMDSLGLVDSLSLTFALAGKTAPAPEIAAPSSATAPTAAAPAVPVNAPVSTPVSTPAPATAGDAPVDGEGVDPEMLEIFVEEAAEVVDTIDSTLAASRAEPTNQEHLITLRRAFHTLKGSGRMVGLKNLGEAGWEMEQLVTEAQEKGGGTPDLYSVVALAGESFARWIAALRTTQHATVDAGHLVECARQVRVGAPLPAAPVQAAPAATVATAAMAAPVAEEAPDLQNVAPIAIAVVIGDVQLSPVLYGIFVEEAHQHIATLQTQAARVASDPAAEVSVEFLRAAHTLCGISGTVGFFKVHELASSLERVLLEATKTPAAFGSEARDGVRRAVERLTKMVAAIEQRQSFEEDAMLTATLERAALGMSVAVPAAPVSVAAPAAPAAEVAPSPQPVAEPPLKTMVIKAQAGAPAPAAAEHQGVAVQDAADGSNSQPADRRRNRIDNDIDAELLTIFLAEAQEMVPQIGQDLRDWRARPDDKVIPQSLKRLLHTLKGGARMAGAMALGELTHNMETRVENVSHLATLPASLFDDLEGAFDRIGVLIEQLHNVDASGVKSVTTEMPEMPEAVDLMSATMRFALAADAMRAATGATEFAATELPATTGTSEIATAGATGPVATAQARADVRQQPAAGAGAASLVRVRASTVEQFANQAGEISIARARAEGELRNARISLRELTESIIRLRGQLREVEIRAETQLQSRVAMAKEGGVDFDPLEFDRFTRLQELTRLMAEGVNDVATVQQNMMAGLDLADAALVQQGRMTLEVQQGLMAIRMVPFSSISDRLYRVTRLTAKDIGKRVNLDIKGAQVEVDRSVLEKITAPFEHMLRNSIAHGIELPDARRAAGKAEIGEVMIEVRQEGNEIALMLGDDGAGLNIERIREKALAAGLMKPEDNLTDKEIAEFIFRSGFSTADKVTEVSGRGVGMDVVRNEIANLGGRVEIDTERGKGAKFTVYLPLTLAVMQAVVLRAGGNLYAVPSLMVEQVQKLKRDEIQAFQQAGEVLWQGQKYPLHYMQHLLGATGAVGGNQRFTPIVLLRSGANRVAIQIDQLIGGQEIVVKNIGPQLARVTGVTGAAVLGNGDTVLIINPVLLVQRMASVKAATETVQQERMKATQMMRTAKADSTAEAPEDASQKTIMVVDDSLTVRKITGRLLNRKGFQVVVAKDGIDALEKLQDVTPDVVLTDVEMPRMDGFELTRNIRADAKIRHLPIIMITSRTAEKHRLHAADLGVDVFLGKPYEESDLLKQINTLLKRPVAVARAMIDVEIVQ